MSKAIFTGSAVAVVTPFCPDGSVNLKKYSELIEWQLENKTDAIVAVGTTGENATLSGEEHRALMKRAIEVAKGRAPVICSTGSNDTAYCIETSRAAKEMGADGLLLVTPYYNKTSQSGLIRHYEMILNEIKLPAILYHIPGRTGLTVKPETFLKLSQNPYVAGIKEASGNVSYCLELMNICGENLPLYSGNDDLTVPLMSMGGLGVISVLANILPEETHRITRLCLDNNFKAAGELSMKYNKLTRLLFLDVNPVPVKAAMDLMGMDVGRCRPPLFEMQAELGEKLRDEMKNLGIIK